MTFDQIAWLPLCAGLTAAGVAFAYLAFRRRGASAGLRATAWALLPLAAYLTGVLKTLWNVGTALVGFATGLVFSVQVWAGIALAGISVLLFFVSGGLRGRTLSRARAARTSGGTAPSDGETKPLPARGAQQLAQQPRTEQPRAATPTPTKASSDEFSDIEDILKKHGIN
ncbi:cellulose synthase [Acrocarpospora catenulata]|uniref:cellulose synthase n=1 Tax=Acrocarpospora catenulata TaxID=2836182 RepID=UPI001BD93C34|nr:cellulose synthase [Acrocarpospora catenulata]